MPIDKGTVTGELESLVSLPLNMSQEVHNVDDMPSKKVRHGRQKDERKQSL